MQLLSTKMVEVVGDSGRYSKEGTHKAKEFSQKLLSKEENDFAQKIYQIARSVWSAVISSPLSLIRAFILRNSWI